MEVQVFFTAAKELSADAAYEIRSSRWKYLDEAVEVASVAADTSPELSRQRLRTEFVVPGHAGSLKYYREVRRILL